MAAHVAAQALGLVVAAAVMSCQSRGAPMKHFCLYYSYFPVNAMFCTGGASSVIISSNIHGGNEIGRYEGVLPEDELKSIRHDMLNPDFRSFMTNTFLQPGSITATFGIDEQGDAEPSFAGFMRDELPKELLAVEVRMQKLAEELRKYPAQVVSATAVLQSRELTKGDELVITARWKNTGKETVYITSPTQGLEGFFPLWLDVLADKPVSKLNSDDRAYMQLGASDLRPDRKSPWPKGDKLKLKRGEEIVVRIVKPVMMTAGRYSAKLLYQSFLDDLENGELAGQLIMNLGTFTVSAKGRRR